MNYSDIDDAVLLTQSNFIKKGAFVDMQTDLQDHVAVREMWKDRKKVFSGGLNWRFDVQMDHNHSARTVGLYENDGSSVSDTMKKGEVPVRHVNAHYIYDQREPDFQRGGAAIVDLVKTRYTAMIVSVYELLEELLWGKPTDSSDDKTPFGIAYWITKHATEGFNGGNPAGFSDGRAGISTVDYPRWANWTAQYADVSKEDLLRKMRRAHRKTKFRSPVSHATHDLGSMKNGIYTNDTVIGLLEEILEAQNMNLGNDLASKDGKAVFKSTPVQYAPYLDEDATDPIYMLDWKWLVCGAMAGWENNVGAPYMVPNKHLVRRVDLDASLNMICTDLRRQAVISK
ncbi:phage major capsid protein [Cerasicoccus frondis]|uniref:phage major capsid protein n=1 Tax=Cerasicoccus frondis TaxID=490090 RepID=UPI0028524D2F|nr:phage major capsid protein [Cerasicoccus frondis]